MAPGSPSLSFVNAGEIDAVISVTATATTGARTITVTNPDTGTGSLTGAFQVT